MDYQKALNAAENKLPAEFASVVQDIKNCIRSGSTGGEIIGRVGKYLKDLKFTNEKAFLILKEDIDNYIMECEKHDIIIL
jgi:hypothetical protein